MLLCGIWHGAGWSFIVWGGIHGIFLVAGVYYRPIKNKLHSFIGWDKSVILKAWQTFFTFNLVAFAWIFFRADNLSDAMYVVTHLTNGIGDTLPNLYRSDILVSSPARNKAKIIGIKKATS